MRILHAVVAVAVVLAVARAQPPPRGGFSVSAGGGSAPVAGFSSRHAGSVGAQPRPAPPRRQRTPTMGAALTEATDDDAAERAARGWPAIGATGQGTATGGGGVPAAVPEQGAGGRADTPPPFESADVFQGWLDMSTYVPPFEGDVAVRKGGARTHDSEAEAPLSQDRATDSDPGAELTLAWGTPLFRTNVRRWTDTHADALGTTLDDINAALAYHSILLRRNVLAGLRASGEGRAGGSMATDATPSVRRVENDEFFSEQLKHGRHMIYTSPAATELRLLHHWLKGAVRDYLRRFVGVPEGELPTDEEVHLSMWTSVHFGGSSHDIHDHHDALISGVYYARVGGGDGDGDDDDDDDDIGRIEFFDPRGMQFPLNDILAVKPKAGDLVLFPGWLLHRVTPVARDLPQDEARVSFSFNWGQASWRLTTNLHVHARSPVDGGERLAQPWQFGSTGARVGQSTESQFEYEFL